MKIIVAEWTDPNDPTASYMSVACWYHQPVMWWNPPTREREVEGECLVCLYDRNTMHIGAL